MPAAPIHPPHSHRLRIGRYSREGGIYLLTFTTRRRQQLFTGFARAGMVASVLSAASTWPEARLLAWVLMPDHWHGLIELRGDEPLSRRVARAKAECTRQWNRTHGDGTSLWAPGFHDHALRTEESLVDCARYIVLNPVRAGLVRRCGDYPFWDAIWVGTGDRD